MSMPSALRRCTPCRSLRSAEGFAGSQPVVEIDGAQLREEMCAGPARVECRTGAGRAPVHVDTPGVAACLAVVERVEERADGRRVVLLRIALQVREEGPT